MKHKRISYLIGIALLPLIVAFSALGFVRNDSVFWHIKQSLDWDDSLNYIKLYRNLEIMGYLFLAILILWGIIKILGIIGFIMSSIKKRGRILLFYRGLYLILCFMPLFLLLVLVGFINDTLTRPTYNVGFYLILICTLALPILTCVFQVKENNYYKPSNKKRIER